MSETRRVPIKSIKIDERIHKPVGRKRLAQLITDWHADLYTPLTVTDRDGVLWLVDGRHRLAAMEALGIKRADVIVIEGLSLVEEAKLFNAMNRRHTRLSKKDIERARAIAEGG